MCVASKEKNWGQAKGETAFEVTLEATCICVLALFDAVLITYYMMQSLGQDLP